MHVVIHIPHGSGTDEKKMGDEDHVRDTEHRVGRAIKRSRGRRGKGKREREYHRGRFRK